MKKYLIELIGTFFLTFVVALTGNPVAIGATLAAMIYMGGYISGGHFNPAISLAVLISKRLSGRDFIGYIIAQLIGATLAAIAFWLLADTTFTPSAGEGFSLLTTASLETLFTFGFVSVFLHTTLGQDIKENPNYGLAIGLMLLAGVYSLGQVTGGVFNPAIGLGTGLVDMSGFNGQTQHLVNFITSYIVGPLLGAAIASIIFRFTSKKHNSNS